MAAPRMEPDALVDALARECDAFAAAARRGLAAPVPACPAFTVGQLTVHLGIIHRRAAKAVRTRATEPVRAERAWFREPDDPGLVEWFEEGATEVVGELRAAGPDAPAWHFLPEQVAGTWGRRMAHETAVHRRDVEEAHGEPGPLDPDLAADGVDELLAAMLPHALWRHGPPEGVVPVGERFHLHRTDGSGEWLVVFEPGGVTVTTEHAKGDLALRGPAADLLLFGWRRLPADRLQVLGDPALVDRWRALVPAL